MARSSARARRKARARGRNGRSRYSLLGDALPFLPAARLLERLHDFAGHIALVVLGENLIAAQPALLAENALDDDALAFAKEVGHVGEAVAEAIDPDALRSVRDIELQPVICPRDGARFDESADPKPCSRLDALFSDFGRRQEQRKAVLHLVEPEPDAAADYGERGGDESEAAAAARASASPRCPSRGRASTPGAARAAT